jgi:hypothetical protein
VNCIEQVQEGAVRFVSRLLPQSRLFSSPGARRRIATGTARNCVFVSAVACPSQALRSKTANPTAPALATRPKVKVVRERDDRVPLHRAG